MILSCIREHNGNDTLLHALDLPGAYTRGETLEIALAKMDAEVRSYLYWAGKVIPDVLDICLTAEVSSELNIADADSDILFEVEQKPFTAKEYQDLKDLALKSATDFLALYESIPEKGQSASPVRKTFYGQVPRTAEEMYQHTKSVNAYYFAEIDVDADNEGTILECRQRGFDTLEQQPDYLQNPVFEGSYGESWSLWKVLRRFLWHDRIHAKAMYRMALREFGENSIPDPFYFHI